LLRESIFFDFLNRRDNRDFEQFIIDSVQDEDFIDWNGFALPFDYGDDEFEYTELRNRCAIFDSTPLQKIQIRGSHCGKLFDRMLTRPVSDLPSMRATYAVMCNDDGTIKDDVILYKFDEDDYLIMPSDIDHTPYFESLCDRFDVTDIVFTNVSEQLAGMAVQGPASTSVLVCMGFEDLQQLGPFEVRDYELGDGTVRVSRVGFTADLGYECWMAAELAPAFRERIIATRYEMDLAIPGYGLRTLESCRLEGGFVVAGWDFSTVLDPQPGFERTPYEVGLGWIVDPDAADFVGRDALIAQKNSGPNFLLRRFQSANRIQIEDGEIIYSEINGKNIEIGFVACSSWSWGVERMIGNASIRAEFKDATNAWLMLDSEQIHVGLERKPLLNFEQRNQVPAPLSG
jgi:glycine cleavage system T protein (aminomethyltransferase)